MVMAAPARSALWLMFFSAAAALGRSTTLAETGLATLWPAAGVAALWLIWASVETLVLDLVLLFVATVAVQWALGVELVPALLLGVANVVVGLSVRTTLAARLGQLEVPSRDKAGEAMGSPAGVIALGQAALVAGLVSAVPGVLAAQFIEGHVSVLVAVSWVVRNATGVFVVCAVVLAVAAARHSRRPGPRLAAMVAAAPRPHLLTELVATIAVTAVVTGLVFAEGDTLPVPFLLVAIAAYVGVRFSPVVAAVLTAGTGTCAIAATVVGRGPFGAIEDPATAALVVQAFVIIQAAISLTLSWSIQERHDLAVELVAAKEEADARAQLLAAVTERLEYGVAVIDGDGHILVSNSAAERLMPGPQVRITEHDHPGRYGVMGPDGVPTDLATLPHAVALATGQSASLGVLVRREDTPDTVVSMSAEVIELTGDHPSRVALVSMRDDTEHHRRVQGLETFAGVVAHDLRNPLAAMGNWIDVLIAHLEDNDALDADVQHALGRIDAASGRMVTMIEGLLAYATASNAPLDPGPVDLDQLVPELFDEIGAATNRTPPPLMTCADLGTIVADQVLMRQVLANLLDNAVKYTPDEERPVVHVSAERSADTVTVRVTDNGVGVPPDMRTAVFDGFTRVADTASHRPGTGLGLAICDRAVERHRGTIALGPGPDGRGSTVTVTLPR